MIKYVVINKETGKELTNPLDDAIEARCWIAAHEKYYPKGLYWTKKECCEHYLNGWCLLKDTGEYGYLCKDQVCVYKENKND